MRRQKNIPNKACGLVLDDVLDVVQHMRRRYELPRSKLELCKLREARRAGDALNEIVGETIKRCGHDVNSKPHLFLEELGDVLGESVKTSAYSASEFFPLALRRS